MLGYVLLAFPLILGDRSTKNLRKTEASRVYDYRLGTWKFALMISQPHESFPDVSKKIGYFLYYIPFQRPRELRTIYKVLRVSRKMQVCSEVLLAFHLISWRQARKQEFRKDRSIKSLSYDYRAWHMEFALMISPAP